MDNAGSVTERLPLALQRAERKTGGPRRCLHHSLSPNHLTDRS